MNGQIYVTDSYHSNGTKWRFEGTMTPKLLYYKDEVYYLLGETSIDLGPREKCEKHFRKLAIKDWLSRKPYNLDVPLECFRQQYKGHKYRDASEINRAFEIKWQNVLQEMLWDDYLQSTTLEGKEYYD